MDARGRQIADLEAALRVSRAQADALRSDLANSLFVVATREKEIRNLREQYALLEGRLNAALERLAQLEPPPRGEE